MLGLHTLCRHNFGNNAIVGASSIMPAKLVFFRKKRIHAIIRRKDNNFIAQCNGCYFRILCSLRTDQRGSTGSAVSPNEQDGLTLCMRTAWSRKKIVFYLEINLFLATLITSIFNNYSPKWR